MSHVTCDVSRVTCLVSHVFFLLVFFLLLFFGQSGEDYWWRVCYQRGLPRLVHMPPWSAMYLLSGLCHLSYQAGICLASLSLWVMLQLRISIICICGPVLRFFWDNALQFIKKVIAICFGLKNNMKNTWKVWHFLFQLVSSHTPHTDMYTVAYFSV